MEDNFQNKTTQEDGHKKAYLYSIRLLAKRDYSRHKLKQKLLDQDHSLDLIENLLDELVERKYLREDYYAEARIKWMMRKGYAPSYIIQKLQQENVIVTFDLINEIFLEYKYSTYSQLEYLIEKKTRSQNKEQLVDFNFRKKLLRYFISKGHTLGQGNEVIEALIRSDDNGEVH